MSIYGVAPFGTAARPSWFWATWRDDSTGPPWRSGVAFSEQGAIEAALQLTSQVRIVGTRDDAAAREVLRQKTGRAGLDETARRQALEREIAKRDRAKRSERAKRAAATRRERQAQAVADELNRQRTEQARREQTPKQSTGPRVHVADALRDLQELIAQIVPADALRTLGLNPTAPIDEMAVARAFRAKARTAHPDSGGSDAAFIQLTEARDRAMRWAKQRKAS